MSDNGEEVTDRSETLSEFFASTTQPKVESSSFTPSYVAELVRRDRDASE